MVHFWATRCPPCRKELPDLESVYNRFKGRGFFVLAITDEDSDQMRRFVAGQKVQFPILLDPGKEAKRTFVVSGIPISFVFDRGGKLVGQILARPTFESPLKILERTGLQ